MDMDTNGEPSEVHVAGDMNIDVLNGKWLEPSYSLLSLSKLIQNTCNLGHFSQLVNSPTRYQYNSVADRTDISCIDHIYTNCKVRCSEVTVSPFGNSDHDMIGYVRFSKDPPTPARTIRKRSYKTFVAQDFTNHLSSIDWWPVYVCQDVDDAVRIFTDLFRHVLNQHAPWTIFQLRKKFTPWVSKETKRLMTERDQAKARASLEAKAGRDSSQLWSIYKKLRNKVNNRLKTEETNFKKNKIKESLDSPSKCWSTTKAFMNWNSNSGPPSQLLIDGKSVTKPSIIASEMNNFFIDKVKLIRDGIDWMPNTFTKCYQIMTGKKCTLNLTHVSREKVLKLLKGLKNSKSTSIDELDNFCVKIAADVIASPLHHIISLSLI